jgi:DNA replication licensing factor MCM3
MQVDRRTLDHHKRKFREFLDGVEDGRYMDKIRQAVDDRNFRFILNINEIRSHESAWATEIIQNPREHLFALQEAATDIAKNSDASYEKILKTNTLQAGFEGSLGSNSVSPRGLASRLINNLVEVEGIVTKCSSIRPKLVKSVLFCPATGKYTIREHSDSTSMEIGMETREGHEALPTSSSFAKEDDAGNPMEVEYGLCQYKNYQSLVLQEMPEKAKVGQLPRSVNIILEHDLVDHAKPGDRVLCVGVYRTDASVSKNGMTSGVFPTILMCNNISIIGKEVGAVSLTAADVRNIRELSNQEDVLDVMSRSLCPSIYGHTFIKKALILQLLGGCERNLENGTHLRGDINVMMVGDPSTAKSQLLRAVMDIAPLAISTTGRGSSGVGLTAAVTTDPETGERRLEAGAMVLADRGMVCIDEFDKMQEIDRVAIHEVMEQQTVTIAKAGIHASLNARCSVLAAANPVYGQYNTTKRPTENIGLPDSLLSRFDLLFIVLDTLDPTLDRTISEHVIKSHQYRRPGTIMEPESLNPKSSLNLDETNDAGKEDTAVWQRGGRVFADGPQSHGDGRPGDILTKEFLRKYIHYAKSRIHPVLSNEAMESIPMHYTTMRAKTTQKNLPITARTLETIIRLSSASAKTRLSASVDQQDVEMAMQLMNYVLFHDVGSDLRPTDDTPIISGTKNGGKDKEGNGDQEQDQEEEETRNWDQLDRGDEDEDDADELSDNDPRYLNVMSTINKMHSQDETDEIPFADLLSRINNVNALSASSQSSGSQRLSQRVAEKILYQLERDNKIMYQDGIVHVI